MMRMASSTSSGEDSWRICLRVRPCTCSMTMYGWGAGVPYGSGAVSSPVSYTETMAGWLSDAEDCASRLNRAWNDGSRARSVRSSLTATQRPSRASWADQTSAIPPRPICSMSS